MSVKRKQELSKLHGNRITILTVELLRRCVGNKSPKDGNKEIIKKYRVNELRILTTHDGRLVVPTTKRHKVLERNHYHILAGHLGISRTHARLKR